MPPAQRLARQAPPTTPLGRSGTTNTSGFISWRDGVYEWTGPAMYRTVDQMVRSDPIVAAVERMVAMPIAEATWTVDPASADPDDLLAAECVRRAFLEHLPWTEFVSQAITSAVRYGHSLHEETYETVTWDVCVDLPDGTQHEETRAMWVPRRLAQRLSATIWQWHTNQLGELEAVTQMLLNGGDRSEVTIPMTQAALFTIGQEGDDYRGLSLLRPAYRSWYTKSKLEVVDAIAQERAGLGTPYGVLPENQDMQTGGATLLGDLSNLRANESGALVVEHGTQLGVLDIKGNPSTIDSCRYHGTQILWAILAAWQGLGHEQTGARATAEVQDDPYWLLCTSVAHALQEAVNRQLVARFLAYNFPNLRRPPVLRVQDITPTDVEHLSRAVQALTFGKVIRPDAGLESHMRGRLGLPDYVPDTMNPEEDEVATDPGAPGGRTDPAGGVGAPTPGNDGSVEDPAGETPADTNLSRAGRWDRLRRALTGQPPGRRWWREPTPLEGHALLAQMDDLVTQERDTLIALCEHGVGRITASLSTQLANPSTAPLSVDDGLVDGLAGDIRGALDRVTAFGRFSIRNELRSQSGRQHLAQAATLKQAVDAALRDVVDRPPLDPEALGIWMDELASRNARQIARRLTSRAEDLGDARLTGVRDSRLHATAETAIRQLAGNVVGQALAAGRRAETRDAVQAGEVNRAVYSALLDSGTCGPCTELDGQSYDPASEEFDRDYPPLYACAGESRCRCMMVLVAASEVPSSAPASA